MVVGRRGSSRERVVYGGEHDLRDKIWARREKPKWKNAPGLRLDKVVIGAIHRGEGDVEAPTLLLLIPFLVWETTPG